jgi:hypothetical protein
MRENPRQPKTKISVILLVGLIITGITLLSSVVAGKMNAKEGDNTTSSSDNSPQFTRPMRRMAIDEFAAPVVQQRLKANLSVDDPRPVATAITLLEAKYTRVITYEDPRYVYSGDISDVTETVRRDLSSFRPGEAPRVLIPKGGKLAFEDDSNERPDPERSLRRLLAAYAANLGSASFQIERREKGFDIFPTAVKNVSGKLVPQASILDSVITLPKRERSGLRELEDVCAAIAKAKQMRVVVGTIPIGLFSHYKEEYGVRSRARDVLIQLLARTGPATHLSWQLLYDPGLKMYVLNIHEVG